MNNDWAAAPVTLMHNRSHFKLFGPIRQVRGGERTRFTSRAGTSPPSPLSWPRSGEGESEGVRSAFAASRVRYAFLPLALLLVLLCTGFGPPILTDGGYPPLRLAPDDITRLMATKQPVQLWRHRPS